MNHLYLSKERVSERFLLNARWSLFRYIMARTRYIQWHGVEVRFVLDQRVSLYLYSARYYTCNKIFYQY
jgi:hypothetical protein